MALCPAPSARGDDRGRPCGSAADLAAQADSGGYVRVPLRRRGSRVVGLLFCSLFVRIGAARCVCFVSDGGRHGASAVSLRAQGDSLGYVRVTCLRRGRLVALLLFCCLFMRITISAA